MRRLFAALLLIVGLASASYALSPGAALILNTGCANGASVILNFAAGTTCGTSFGALNVVRATTTAYEDDSAGNWIAFGPNTLRMTNKGALIEESRTNSVRNNSMQGAVAGSPGTVPTNWTITSTVLTRTIVGVGTQNGVDYIDVRFSGTASGTAINIIADTTTQIAASNGQSWTYSHFFAVLSDVGAAHPAYKSEVDERDGAGGFLAATTASFTPDSNFTRYNAVRTNNNASTAFEIGYAGITVVNGSAYDFTLRIGWPQLELGAFVTSPIRTTTAAATRAADAVSQTNFAFGPAYSFFVQGVPNTTGYAQNSRVLSVNAGDVSHEVAFYRPATNALGIILNGSGFGSSAWSAAARGKGAAAIAASDQAFSFNGGTVTTNAAASIPSPTQMNIGDTPASSAFWNGYIERVDIWPNTRLPNATLQRLTAP